MQNMSLSTDSIDSQVSSQTSTIGQPSISFTASSDDHHHHHEAASKSPSSELLEREIVKLQSENVELRNQNANLQKRLEDRIENDDDSISSDGGSSTLHERWSLRVEDYMSMNHNHGHRNAAYRVRVPEMGSEVTGYNQGAFKTEGCKHWRNAGMCSYGDRCQFAHGNAELRYTIRSPNYMTEVCRAFLAGSHCRYGDRCHFRHEHG